MSLYASAYPCSLSMSQPSALKNGSRNSRRSCVPLRSLDRYASRLPGNRSTSRLTSLGAVLAQILRSWIRSSACLEQVPSAIESQRRSIGSLRRAPTRSSDSLSFLSISTCDDSMPLSLTNARMTKALISIAPSERRMLAAVMAPCLEKAIGGVHRPPRLEITVCDLKLVCLRSQAKTPLTGSSRAGLIRRTTHCTEFFALSYRLSASSIYDSPRVLPPECGSGDSGPHWTRRRDRRLRMCDPSLALPFEDDLQWLPMIVTSQTSRQFRRKPS